MKQAEQWEGDYIFPTTELLSLANFVMVHNGRSRVGNGGRVGRVGRVKLGIRVGNLDPSNPFGSKSHEGKPDNIG